MPLPGPPAEQLLWLRAERACTVCRTSTAALLVVVLLVGTPWAGALGLLAAALVHAWHRLLVEHLRLESFLAAERARAEHRAVEDAAATAAAVADLRSFPDGAGRRLHVAASAAHHRPHHGDRCP